MSWGDPYESIYKDDIVQKRYESIVGQKLISGTLIEYGTYAHSLSIWKEPDILSDMCYMPGPVRGLIITCDCISDAAIDWLLVLLYDANKNSIIGWIPVSSIISKITLL